MNQEKAKINIMIIDDDLESVTMLDTALRTHDRYVIDVVRDGQEGCDKLHSLSQSGGRCDLLILEMLTPTMTGDEICRRMVDHDQLRKVPVILTSMLPLHSAEFTESLKKFREFSIVNGLLQKPFKKHDVDALLAESFKNH